MKTDNSADQTITIALAGNPNSGKTTIFNNLTGSSQHVGNYPGVTVDTKEGFLKRSKTKIRVVDLPGTYSLTAYTLEEIVARNFILDEKPAAIVNVIDSTNLERNLYLSVQFKELGVPLILVLNMTDELRQRGFNIDTQQLSQSFNAPVVMTIGSKNEGTPELIDKIIEVTQGNWQDYETVPVHYGQEIDTEVERIAELIDTKIHHSQDLYFKTVSSKWLALKLLENDSDARNKIADTKLANELQNIISSRRNHLENVFGDDPEIVIAEQRYGHATGISRAVLKHTMQMRVNLSDKIDKILTNRVLGLPIFAILMYFTFWLVFTIGEIPMGWIETGQIWLADTVASNWPGGNLTLLRSLILDGIIGGVGGVIIFLPNIMLLFLAIALLEDTGYMARAAFIMDRLMKWVGLHGKSFIPMLMGFGCSVPAIMGTRVLDNRRDRLTTMLILPLMSCGARFPIYMLIIPAFFARDKAALVMYSMYIIGIIIAVIAAKVLRSTVFRGKPSPFVMELPPYRIPTPRAIFLHMWQRSWLYLKKAGTVILGISIILWALSVWPAAPLEKLEGLTKTQTEQFSIEYSAVGRIGRFIEPALKPMGFDWRIGTALVGALAAKEVFVSQMGIVYSLGETDEGSQALQNKLRKDYSALTGFCVMLFCLISAPCVATMAITRRESGSWKWALAQFGGLTALAYILTTIVYQVGSLIQG